VEACSSTNCVESAFLVVSCMKLLVWLDSHGWLSSPWLLLVTVGDGGRMRQRIVVGGGGGRPRRGRSGGRAESGPGVSGIVAEG
jgi:hypothetical protein